MNIFGIFSSSTLHVYNNEENEQQKLVDAHDHVVPNVKYVVKYIHA